MKNRQGCVFGIIQVSVVLCVVAVFLALVMGNALRREGSLVSFFKANANPVQGVDASTADDSFDAWQLGSDAQAAEIVTATTSPTQVPSPTPTATPDVVFAVVATNTSAPSPPPTDTATPLPPPPPTTIPTEVVAPTSPPQLVAGSVFPERQVTRLVIPALELDVPVLFAPIEGDTWQIEHLDQAAGHLEGTASPGDANNVVLAGHITLPPDGRNGPFIGLGKLSAGDSMVVYHQDATFTYIVDRMETVKPTEIQVTHPSSDARLTLITCLNYDRASGRYADRLVVVGHLVD